MAGKTFKEKITSGATFGVTGPFLDASLEDCDLAVKELEGEAQDLVELITGRGVDSRAEDDRHEEIRRQPKKTPVRFA